MSTLPVFICRQPEAWAAVSVYSDRITHRSSANRAVCGKRLLISRPLWPCLRERERRLCIRWPIGRPLEPTGVSPVYGCAVVLRRAPAWGRTCRPGWAPPFMNRKTTCLALAGKCGGLGASRYGAGRRRRALAARLAVEEAVARQQVDQRQAREPAARPARGTRGATGRTGSGSGCSGRSARPSEGASSPVSIGVDELVEVEDHAAQLLERQRRPPPGRSARSSRPSRRPGRAPPAPGSASSRRARPASAAGTGPAGRPARPASPGRRRPRSTSRSARCRACRLTKSPLNSVSACGATRRDVPPAAPTAPCRRSRAPRASARPATA